MFINLLLCYDLVCQTIKFFFVIFLDDTLILFLRHFFFVFLLSLTTDSIIKSRVLFEYEFWLFSILSFVDSFFVLARVMGGLLNKESR